MSHKLLLVMPPQRRERLINFLATNGLEVLAAASAGEASRILSEPFHFDVVLVEAELPDGSWRDLIPFVVSSTRPCEMLVCTRFGEENLWAEVLQSGVYDLIQEPYEAPETLRIIQSSVDNQYMRLFRHPMEAKAS